MLNRLFLAALTLVTLVMFASMASAAPTDHELWVRAALDRVPVSQADRRDPARLEQHAAQLDAFAVEIAKVSMSAPLAPQQWASLLITQGSIESNFDTAIVAGNCPRFWCDMTRVKGLDVFRARGAFQNWDVRPVHDLWPVANNDPAAQVQMADRMLRRSMTRCKPFAPFPAHVFRAYRGKSCSWAVPRETLRVATFNMLLRTPRPSGASS